MENPRGRGAGWRRLVAGACLILVLASGAPLGAGEVEYDPEVVARSGASLGDLVPVTLGKGPSINDDGRVAFTARDGGGREGLYVRSEDGIASYLGRVETFTLHGEVQINNAGRVAWREKSEDGLFTNVKRVGPGGSKFQIVAQAIAPPFVVLSPFDLPLPWVSLDNHDRVVFSADIGATTALHTPKDPDAEGLAFLDDYWSSPPLTGYPEFFPMIADNGTTVVRGGGDETAPIMLFVSEELVVDDAIALATSADFSYLGARPGISDDGAIVVFMGTHRELGGGIFAVHVGAGVPTLFPVAGDAGFSSVGTSTRVGVNRLTPHGTADYVVAYLAARATGGPPASDPFGLFVSTIHLSEAPPRIGDPVPVIEVGDAIGGLSGRVADIGLYDPVNDRGQLAFWVRTDTGEEAILRATPRPRVHVEVFDADPLDTGAVELPLAASDDSFLRSILAGADWAESARAVRRVAADGVTLLLVRVEVPPDATGRVSLGLTGDDEQEDPGSLWTVDDPTLVNTDEMLGGRDEAGPGESLLELEVSEATTGDTGARYLFALYRSPRNFVGDGAEHDIALTISIPRTDGPPLAAEETLVLVRPPVFLVHGTFDSIGAWTDFPLWEKSGNFARTFELPATGDPEAVFQTSRLTFALNVEPDTPPAWATAGPLPESSMMLLSDLRSWLFGWRLYTKTAGTQADVVTHSYGGLVMRKAIAQGDPSKPLADRTTSFRNRYNRGYGAVHKLITIAATHRGSPFGNHLARLNRYGRLGKGKARSVASSRGLPIHLGAVRDQFVVSKEILDLPQTRVPCHAIVGSGRPAENLLHAGILGLIVNLDAPGGPFRSLFSAADLLLLTRPDLVALAAALNAKAVRGYNYFFNLDYDTLREDAPLDPNYDLIVSTRSARGGLPDRATTDVVDSADGWGHLVGRLTHTTQIGPQNLLTALHGKSTVAAVSDRVTELLKAPIPRRYHERSEGLFDWLPAPGALALSAPEEEFGRRGTYDPAWLELKDPGAAKTGGSNAGKASAGGEPVLTVDPPAEQVVAGDELTLRVDWPGKDLGDVAFVWSGAGPWDGVFRPLEAGETSTVLTVPPRTPGPFTVSAIVGTKKKTRWAFRTLEVVDPEPYVELRVGPAALDLRSDIPGRLSIVARTASGGFRDVSRSSSVVVTSADDSVATTAGAGRVLASGPGDTSVSVALPGLDPVVVPVRVRARTMRVTVALRKRRTAIDRSSRRKVAVVIFSDPELDALALDPDSIRLAGERPLTRGKHGKLQRKRKDVDRDGRRDLTVFVRGTDLPLAPGPAVLSVRAAAGDHSLMAGDAEVLLK